MLTNPDDPLAKRTRRGHGRPTLHDVAQLAGVTRITVSRFLRNPSLVAAETATRIRDAVARTGYTPNHQAGQLASGRSLIVAALIPNVGHSIFAETIQGLAEGLQGSGRELLLASTGYSTEREEQQLRTLLGWSPAAVIVTGRHHTPAAQALLRDSAASGTPVVEIWDHQDDATFAQIGFDHAAVGRAMAAHLIERGHRRLAYVDSGVAEDFRAHERGAAFAAAARASGASVRLLTATTGDAFDAGREVFARLHEGGARDAVSAAAFANDHIACGALMQAQADGVVVPAHFSLIGFGDFPLGRQLRPGLTTIRPPRYEIGHAAAQAVLAAIDGAAPVVGRALPWALIERDSSAPKR